MCKTVSFSLAFLFALCVVASVESSMNMRLCSSQLNDMLSKLCTRGFNSLINNDKRSSPMLDLDPLDPIQYIEQKEANPNSAELLAYPLSNARLRNLFRQENALSSLTATRRRTRGQIVDECCARPCQITELMGYCAA